MSTRQMGQYYRAQSVRTSPDSDIDLFGMKERRRTREADRELQREKLLEEYQRQQRQEEARFMKDLEEDKLNPTEANSYGKTVKEWRADPRRNQIADTRIEGVKEREKQLVDFDKSEQGKQAIRIGNTYKAVGANPNTMKVGQGEVMAVPPLPGINPGLLSGGITRMHQELQGGIPFLDENGKYKLGPDGKPIMLGQEKLNTPVTTPGSYRPGSMRPPRVSSADDRFLGKPSGDTSTIDLFPEVGGATPQGSQSKAQQETQNVGDGGSSTVNPVPQGAPALMPQGMPAPATMMGEFMRNFNPRSTPRSGAIPSTYDQGVGFARDNFKQAGQDFKGLGNQMIVSPLQQLYQYLFGGNE